jgi:putative transposase
VRDLDQLIERRGVPKVIRSDNGPEYINKTVRQWAIRRGIGLEYIQPGKPQQSAYVAHYNRSVRDAWLAQMCFDSFADVQASATRSLQM